MSPLHDGRFEHFDDELKDIPLSIILQACGVAIKQKKNELD